MTNEETNLINSVTHTIVELEKFEGWAVQALQHLYLLRNKLAQRDAENVQLKQKLQQLQQKQADQQKSKL
jgi:hypothetical protein